MGLFCYFVEGFRRGREVDNGGFMLGVRFSVRVGGFSERVWFGRCFYCFGVSEFFSGVFSFGGRRGVELEVFFFFREDLRSGFCWFYLVLIVRFCFVFGF